MPVAYYNITTKLAIRLVEANDLENLDKYLINSIEENKKLYDLVPNLNHYGTKNEYYEDLTDTYNERLYHILTWAIEKKNFFVLNYYSDKIDINYAYDEGNVYSYIHFAINNYIEEYTSDLDKNKKNYDIIIFLIETQTKNNIIKHKESNSTSEITYNDNYIQYYSHMLSNFCDKNENYELVSELITKYDADLFKFYESCIADNLPKMFDWLIDNFYDKIDIKWTKNVILDEYRTNEEWINENSEIIKHVLNKIKILNYEEYEKLNFFIENFYSCKNAVINNDLESLKKFHEEIEENLNKLIESFKSYKKI